MATHAHSDAIFGCLLGGAIGDAIGLPCEGLSAARRRRVFGAIEGHRLLWGRGTVSDDTEHSCMTAQALIESAGDPDLFACSLARQLKRWLLLLPAAAGFATLRACIRLWLGVPPGRSGVFSAGNGPSMRSAIIGVYCGEDIEWLQQLVGVSTRITHTVPRQGLMGDPYITMANFASDDRRELSDKQVRALVSNLVEHGMRIIHLGPSDTFRWHFSPQAKFKGKELDWLEVSDDGQVALDTSQFDRLVETCDSAARPYSISYMLYNNTLLDTGYSDFKKAFPHRFAGKPERTGSTSQSYYVQEMYQLFKRHLEKRGWLKRFVVKIADEPRGFNTWYNGTTVAAREVGLPFMTAFNNIDWAEAEKAIDKIALWQPLYMLHNPEFFQKAKQAGTLVSWYNCGPPPRIAMGASAGEIRGYTWQAAKADLDAVAWWGIQCWPGNNTEVWRNRFSHWDSVMYPVHPKYPPWQKPGKGWVDQSPIDGIRYELIREGLEDARYVNLLRSLITLARQRRKPDEAAKAEAVLDGIWNEVFPTLNDYRPPYTAVMESRRKVAAAIVALQSALGVKPPQFNTKAAKTPAAPSPAAPAAPISAKANEPSVEEPDPAEQIPPEQTPGEPPPVEQPRTAQPVDPAQ